MRMHLIMLVLLLNCFALSYGQQVKFTKNQDIFTIECESYDYDVFRGKYNDFALVDSTNTTEIDSIITVQNQGDTLSVFISKEGFVAFCYYQSGEYHLSELQAFTRSYGDNLGYINYLDINNDNKLEFVTEIGSDEGNAMYVFTYRKMMDDGYSYRDYENIITHEFEYPSFPYTGDSTQYDNIEYVKISHNKLYLLYGYWKPGSMDSQCQLRYGMLDYTRDKAKEIYFRPISFITLKQWEKL
jgi:hypothetical protein